jgi:hypothetical protein
MAIYSKKGYAKEVSQFEKYNFLYLPILGYPRVLDRLRDHVAHLVSPGASSVQ